MTAPFKPPSSFLGATKRIGDFEIPVTQVELDHGISSGVRLRALGVGLVPLYEEHQCRISEKISIDDWIEMQEFEKAVIIASYRIKLAIDNLRAEAEIKKMKSDSRKKR